MITNDDKLIYKSNDLIQKFKNTFSLQEMKILNFIIASIKSPKYDKEFNAVTVSIKELAEEIGYSCKGKIGGKTYDDIKSALSTLNRQQSDFITIEGYDGRPIETIIRWLERPIIDKEKGVVILKLDDLLKPYLLNLSKNFTKYELLISTKMQSKYSLKLYELLKSWEKVKEGTKKFDLEKLKEYLDVPKSYSNFSNLEKKAIIPAIDEINNITDLMISYTTETKGKKVVSIIFHISKKEIKTDPPVVDLDEKFYEEKENILSEYLCEDDVSMNEINPDWLDIQLKNDEFLNISRLREIDPDIDTEKIKYIYDLALNTLEKDKPDLLSDPNDDRSINQIVGTYVGIQVRKIVSMDNIHNKYNYFIKMLENEYKSVNQKV